ncbi:uncharacterized protein LOC144151717 [Haemaphysalis longicornis]
MDTASLTPVLQPNDHAFKAAIKGGVVLSPYPPVELIPKESLYQYLKRRFLPRAHEPALERNGRWLTFGEVLNLLERYVGGFQRCGVSTGSRVCVHVSNSAEALLATYAICCAGAAAVLAKPSLKEREVLYQVKDSGATFVLTEEENLEKILNVHSKWKFKSIFSMDPIKGYKCIQDFEMENTDFFNEPIIEDASSHIMLYTYTSGTTGLPKGVEISVHACIASIELTRAAEVYYEDDVFLAWNPVTHASGFIFALTAWCCGARVVSSPGDLSPAEFVDVVNKHQVTSLCAFPMAFRKLVFDLEKGLVPSLKRIITCGTVSTEELYRKILEVFQLKSLRNAYGMSETIGFVCITQPNTFAFQSIGYPLSGTEVKIVDGDTGVVLGDGELGEITFRVPNLMRGYHNRPEATAEVLDKQRWLRSGDAGYHDGRGRFYMVERLKDMIKCLDQQVAPAEIEALLTGHPLVLEAAVIGIKHPHFGEAPTAFVVLQNGVRGHVVEEELLKLVADQTASHKHLHGGVMFVDCLPKTDTGKIMRAQLRVQYSAAVKN